MTPGHLELPPRAFIERLGHSEFRAWSRAVAREQRRRHPWRCCVDFLAGVAICALAFRAVWIGGLPW